MGNELIELNDVECMEVNGGKVHLITEAVSPSPSDIGAGIGADFDGKAGAVVPSGY